MFLVLLRVLVAYLLSVLLTYWYAVYLFPPKKYPRTRSLLIDVADRCCCVAVGTLSVVLYIDVDMSTLLRTQRTKKGDTYILILIVRTSFIDKYEYTSTKSAS